MEMEMVDVVVLMITQEVEVEMEAVEGEAAVVALHYPRECQTYKEIH